MRAATTGERVRAQTRFEVATILGNGEQLLVTFILPLLLLVVLATTNLVGVRPLAQVMPAILALAVMSSAFTSQAVATAFDRRSGVLRLLATTPLGRGGLVAGKVGAIVLIGLAQVVLLGGIGVGLGWRPAVGGLPAALLMLVAGTGAFATLGLWLAGAVRAEAVLALANLVWVLLLLFGGIMVSTDQFPPLLGTLASLLPSAALATGLAQATSGAFPLTQLALLALWSALAAYGATRWFRWE